MPLGMPAGLVHLLEWIPSMLPEMIQARFDPGASSRSCIVPTFHLPQCGSTGALHRNGGLKAKPLTDIVVWT